MEGFDTNFHNHSREFWRRLGGFRGNLEEHWRQSRGHLGGKALKDAILHEKDDTLH